MSRSATHRTCAIVVIVGSASWTAAAQAACTVSEREVGGEPSVVLENEYVRLVLQPGRADGARVCGTRPAAKSGRLPTGARWA